MNLKIYKNIKFTNYYKKLNFLSLFLILASLLVLFFQGLNFGVDFKGGTLIEIRVDNPVIRIGDIRESFVKMNLGDINVKKFSAKEISVEVTLKIKNPNNFKIKVNKSKLDIYLNESLLGVATNNNKICLKKSPSF